MALGGLTLLKQVAAAHLGNETVQEQLCLAVMNLAANADNQVRRPDREGAGCIDEVQW